MGLRQNIQILLIAASAATAQTQQQNSADPNNPANQNGGVPTLLNHGAGFDELNQGPFPTVTDKQFAQLTMYRAMLEIQLGQMAIERGTAPGVKALGHRMVADYSKWKTGLERAAGRFEIKVPSDLDAKRKATVDRLAGLTGREFDQAYVKEMMDLQNRALTITQHEAANAGFARFRNWAGLMMPTLEEHMKMTKQALQPVEEASR